MELDQATDFDWNYIAQLGYLWSRSYMDIDVFRIMCSVDYTFSMT